MRTEDLKRTILEMFGREEFYGYEVHKELVSKKVEVETSRLYRVLTQMLRDGLLESRWERGQHGPRKRVYRLGRKGRKERERILLDAIETVHGFYSEYLQNLPVETNVFSRVCRLLTSNLRGKGDIAYVTSEYSVTHEKILRGLHKEAPEAKIYLVKPESLTVDSRLDNFWSVNGTYADVPLKENYVDLLIVAGLPSGDFLEESLAEWHRVLRQGGTLAISTPTVLVHEYEDPMSIGNFVEKHEHQPSEKEACMNSELLKALLGKFFCGVEEKQIVHMTFFLASKAKNLD